MAKPDVSVVVPVYNVPPKLLTKSIESLFAQTLRPHQMEIVVVNDRSTNEDTLATVRELVARADNVRLVDHERNQGLNAARHTGVLHARGDYILFLDGDDMLARDSVEKLLRRARQSGAQLVTSGAVRWNEHTKSQLDLPSFALPLASTKIERLKDCVSARRSFAMWGKLFRKDILHDGIFDLPEHFLHEDIVTFSRILFEADDVATIPDRTVKYLVNEASITQNFRERHVECMIYAIRDWGKLAKQNGLYDTLESSMVEGAERLIKVLVERTLMSGHDVDEKCSLLDRIAMDYEALPLPRPIPAATYQGTKFLDRYCHSSPADQRWLVEHYNNYIEYNPDAHPTIEVEFTERLRPTKMAAKLTGKVVFLAQVDYHVRNAFHLAEALAARGRRCVVLDNSNFVEKGLRRFNAEVEYIPPNVTYERVSSGPYWTDWLSSADLVVTFHDWNLDFREALEYRHALGMPTVCVVEGINDFLRVDFANDAPLSYRNCDHVLLAGRDDEKYFEDRPTEVVGLPGIEVLGTRAPVFPDTPRAVLNVNFTYGALEDKRDRFVEEAVKGFEKAGIEFVVTQHPADKGAIPDEWKSSASQYELIDRESVFVSRFATGILEALASGKPVVYFNPHGEKVAKFKDPMGAYEVATTAEELADALGRVMSDIADGVDFRERAAAFLECHTGYGLPHSAALRFADAAERIIAASSDTIEEIRMRSWRQQHPFYPKGPLDQSIVSELAPASGNKGRVLYLVISNNRYRERYALLQQEYRKKVVAPDDYIFVVGGAEAPWIDHDAKVMHIDAGDAYENLPEKVIKSIAFAHRALDFDTLVKVDDDVAINFECLNQIFDATSAHYFGKMTPSVRGAVPSTTWHFGKVSETSRFHDTPFDFSEGPENWPCGGMYAMSRYAAALVDRALPDFDYSAYLYEDHMMGSLLTVGEGIEPLFVEELGALEGTQFITTFLKAYLDANERLDKEALAKDAARMGALHCGPYPPHYTFSRPEVVEIIYSALDVFDKERLGKQRNLRRPEGMGAGNSNLGQTLNA